MTLIMRKYAILWDMDGVLADFDPVALPFVGKHL